MTTTTTTTATTEKQLLKIASDKLGLTTLEAQGRDALDFHDLHVAGVKDALEAAYELGRREANADLSNAATAALGIIKTLPNRGLVVPVRRMLNAALAGAGEKIKTYAANLGGQKVRVTIPE